MCANCPVCEGREGEESRTNQRGGGEPLSDSECYKLSMNECHANSSCFYCISQNQDTNYTCRNSSNPKYGCMR